LVRDSDAFATEPPGRLVGIRLLEIGALLQADCGLFRWTLAGEPDGNEFFGPVTRVILTTPNRRNQNRPEGRGWNVATPAGIDTRISRLTPGLSIELQCDSLV